MRYGVVILAGGKSFRMGTPKHQLQTGGVRFLDRLAQEFGGFSELMVSVDDASRHPEIPYPMVSDKKAGCGPMGGLHAALACCVSDALVTVPCDVPYFSKTIADRLCENLTDQADAAIAVTMDLRKHPLCGVYKKSCLEVLETCLEQGNYRMMDALAKLRVTYYQAGCDSWHLSNVNTPEEFLEIQNQNLLSLNAPVRKPGFLAVCGWKNSGKTTLIQNLIPLLKQKGYQVAAIKHDGHHFEPDVPGTDSFRFFQAGADLSVVYDAEKYALSRRKALSHEDIAKLAHGMDLVLLEGFKWSSYPKLEIIRKENGGTAMPDIKGRIAYASDAALSAELPVFGLADTEGIAAFIMEAYESGRLN